MPLPFFDFGQHNRGPINNGLGEIFENYQKGQEIGATPHRLAQERLARELQNQLFGEQITGAQQQNQYYPQIQEQALQRGQIENQYLPQEKQLSIQTSQQALSKSMFENMLNNRFGEQQAQTDLDYRNAQIQEALAKAEYQKSGMAHLTPKQKELADIYGYGTPEYASALKRQYGVIDGADIPAGAVPLDTMSPGERNEATKIMRQNLTKSNDLSKAHKTLSEMQKIMNEHPNMADHFASALVDPTQKSSIFGQLKRIGADKKDLAAIEKFTKLSNDLILSAGQAMGSKSFTDAKLKLLEMAKPSARNTDEANKFVIKHMMEEFEPYVGYSKALQHGLQNRYEVLDVPESYRTIDPKVQEVSSQLNSGLKNSKPVSEMTDAELLEALNDAE